MHLILLAAGTLASADLRAALPTTAPAATATTQPSPEELHARAYQLMRDGKFDLATPLLIRAYDRTPPAQRSRALVLNRANLDLVQRVNPMRGLKDLQEYMTREKTPDEEASNVLGSLLDVASQTPRLRGSRVYKDASRESARREAALERDRPGFKRWGAKWVTEADYAAIKARDRELEAQIKEQVVQLYRINDNIQSASQRYENASRLARGLAFHRHAARSIPTNEPGVVFIQPGGECTACKEMIDANESVTELAAELQSLQAELKVAERRVEQSQAKLSAKPQWPRRYAPIDPNAPPPRPPQTTIAGVPAAPPASEEAGVGSAEAVPGDSAVPPSPAATQPTDLIR